MPEPTRAYSHWDPASLTQFRGPSELVSLQQCLSREPRNPSLKFLLGRSHFLAENFYHAECYLYDSAFSGRLAGPRFLDALLMLAECYRLTGDDQAARQTCLHAERRFGADERLRQVKRACEAQTSSTAGNGHAVVFAAAVPLGIKSDRICVGPVRSRLPRYTHIDTGGSTTANLDHNFRALLWPIADNSVDAIVAPNALNCEDVRLPDLCNEAWRVLRAGGEIAIHAPYWLRSNNQLSRTAQRFDEAAFLRLDHGSGWNNGEAASEDRPWRVASIGVRESGVIHAVLIPRKEAERTSSVARFVTTVAPYLQEPRIVLDLGARDALQSIELANALPHATVFAFEAHPGSAAVCRKNAEGQDRVEVVECAVHEVDGEVPFFPVDQAYIDNVGASSLFIATGRQEMQELRQLAVSVQAARLDTWAQQRGVDRVDLVWADLQGAEMLALRGMGNLLQTVQAIHLEVAYKELYAGQPLYTDVHAFLVQHGFRCLDHLSVCAWFGDAIYVRDRGAVIGSAR